MLHFRAGTGLCTQEDSVTTSRVTDNSRPGGGWMSGIQAVSVSGSMGCGHLPWGGQLSCICLDIAQPSLD